MALDTLKLRSPYIPESVASAIEARLVLRQAIDRPTGELLYSLTSGSLEGSWDSRVSVEVKREEWVARPLPGSATVHTSLQPCEPYLLVEGSVHKALLGHNLHGGPCDLLSAARWFISHLALQLGCELPDAAMWLLRRVDWAEVYRLSYAAIQEYVHGLNAATFPRRSVARYGDQSLSSPGSTSTVKVYHKGPEFYAHDRRRLKAQLSDAELANLQEEANELLRVEVSLKARKLDDDFGHPPTVGEVDEAYLLRAYDREVARLLREGGSTMKTVRKHHEVRDRLYEVYKPRLAGVLFGTWLQLAALGDDATRKHMKRATFYLHRKQLQDAGISWRGADVYVRAQPSALPAGFAPVRSDPRRLTGEHPRVVEQLRPFRVAA